MKRILFITAILMSSTVGVSHAADMNYMERPIPSQTNVEYGSGWYLRGDIAYNAGGKQKTGFSYDTVTNSSNTFEYEDALGVSVGFGQYVSENIRWDATYSRLLSSSSSQNDSIFFPGLDTSLSAYVQIDGSEELEVDLHVDNFMVQGYMDLGKFGTITPYVGAGIGAARVEYSEMRTWTCSPSADVYCITPPGGVGEQVVEVVSDESSVEWMLSYALTAGAAIDIAPNTKLDLSYQYLNVGSGGDLIYGSSSSGFEGVELHRASVGLRYDIW